MKRQKSIHPNPPKIARRILSWLFPDQGQLTTVGDLDEVFRDRTTHGLRKARLWYWMEMFKAVPIALSASLSWRFIMLAHHLKMAFRHFRKERLYAVLNVLGLSLGMACILTISLFSYHELSFDRFHKNADRLYRLTSTMDWNGQEIRYAATRSTHLDLISQNIPDVEMLVPVTQLFNQIAKIDERPIPIQPVATDPGFFKLFSFQLLQGDPSSALEDPHSALITPRLAETFFGDADPIGRVFSIMGMEEYRITGILQPFPANSQIQTELLIPLQSVKENIRRLVTGYVLLKDAADPASTSATINTFMKNHFGDRIRNVYSLTPLLKIHFSDDAVLDFTQKSDPRYLLFLSALALAILIISCINYTNLTLARALNRQKEIGLRKVIGARRVQIIRQILVESILFAALGGVIGFLLTLAVLPVIARWTQISLAFHLEHTISVYFLFLSILLAVGLIAGFYPALLISRFTPADLLKGQKMKTRRDILRKSLVILQFLLSALFLSGTIILISQFNYLVSKDKGFDPSGILVIPYFRDSGIRDNPDLFKERVERLPGVAAASMCDITPGFDPDRDYQIVPEGMNGPILVPMINMDEDYFDLLRIPIVRGRSFSNEIPLDRTNALIVNEAAVRAFGWEDPIGKRIFFQSDQTEGTVVGIARDFHMESLRRPIRPWIFSNQELPRGIMAVRVIPSAMEETIKQIKIIWDDQTVEDTPFESQSFEDNIERMYPNPMERRMITVVRVAAVFSLCIACLGLFGLASFSMKSRTKEIGIRKVLGASIGQMGRLLSRNYLLMVMAANLFACPATLLLMNRWLARFAYRIRIPVWIFPVVAVLSLLIALGTVAFHTNRAARSNMVEALHYE